MPQWRPDVQSFDIIKKNNLCTSFAASFQKICTLFNSKGPAFEDDYKWFAVGVYLLEYFEKYLNEVEDSLLILNEKARDFVPPPN
jgi:hypothetical protein